nr:SIS domain-containing protein [Maliibacterium massiliense]
MPVTREEIARALRACVLAVSQQQLDAMAAAIPEASRVYFYARGRQMDMLGTFAMRVHHMGYRVYVVGEAAVPPIDAGDLLIFSDGRGDDAIVSVQLDIARRAGAKLCCLSAYPASPNAARSDLVVEIPAAASFDGTDALQPSGTLYDQALLLTLDYTVRCIMDAHSWQECDLSVRHTNML